MVSEAGFRCKIFKHILSPFSNSNVACSLFSILVAQSECSGNNDTFRYDTVEVKNDLYT